MSQGKAPQLKAKDPFFAIAFGISLALMLLWWGWLEGLPWLLQANLLPAPLAFALQEAGWGRRMLGQELLLAFGCFVLGVVALSAGWMYFFPNLLRRRRRRRGMGWLALPLFLAALDEASDGD